MYHTKGIIIIPQYNNNNNNLLMARNIYCTLARNLVGQYKHSLYSVHAHTNARVYSTVFP